MFSINLGGGIGVSVAITAEGSKECVLAYMFLEGFLIVTHSSRFDTSRSWTQMLDPETSMPSRPPSLPPRMMEL